MDTYTEGEQWGCINPCLPTCPPPQWNTATPCHPAVLPPLSPALPRLCHCSGLKGDPEVTWRGGGHFGAARSPAGSWHSSGAPRHFRGCGRLSFQQLFCSHVLSAVTYQMPHFILKQRFFFWGGGVEGGRGVQDGEKRGGGGEVAPTLSKNSWFPEGPTVPLAAPTPSHCLSVGSVWGWGLLLTPLPPGPALFAPPPQRCGFHTSSLHCSGSGVAPGCSARPKSGSGASADPTPPSLPSPPQNPAVGCGAVWGSVGRSVRCRG